MSSLNKFKNSFSYVIIKKYNKEITRKKEFLMRLLEYTTELYVIVDDFFKMLNKSKNGTRSNVEFYTEDLSLK